MKHLCIALSFLLSIYTPTLARTPVNVPPKEETQRTRAQGTRGCPIQLGELWLVGKELKTHWQEPILLFWLFAPQKTTVLITVVDPNSEQTAPLFSQQLTISGTGYYPVKVQTELKPGIKYRVSAGILCQGSVANAKILETTITRVESETALDRTILSLSSQNWGQLNVSEIQFYP